MWQSLLKELLHYDKDSGEFTWKVSPSPHVKEGMTAGWVDGAGYITISLFRTSYKAHNLAWLYVNGDWPKDFLDHINRVRSDNRINNLREATRAQNGWNRKFNKNNTSGFKGVSYFKPLRKWRAAIDCNYERIHLGYFDKKEEAGAAYKEAALRLHGEFTAEERE